MRKVRPSKAKPSDGPASVMQMTPTTGPSKMPTWILNWVKALAEGSADRSTNWGGIA